MFKSIIIFLLFFNYLKSELFFSIQLATFQEKEKAELQKDIFNEKEIDVFLYKTDRGYFTLRKGKFKSREEAETFKKNSLEPIIKKGFIVPTSSEKLEQKETKIEKPKISEEPKEIKVVPEKKDEPNLEFFLNRIEELEGSYKRIDSFTFRLKIEKRVYVIQFSNNPKDEMATKIFNEKPTSKNIDSITLSNDLIHIFFELGEIEKSREEIERTLLPILNGSRKNENIRVKAYRLK
jgi:hypothetical protein